jgi:DNA adenine methylase
MKYMGSKNRIVKHILPLILHNRKPDQWYVEPFVGGANMIDKITGPRIGGELNKYVYALLVKMQEGWEPPQLISEETWYDVKNNKDKYPDHFVAYCGICLSFGSVWFCTYARDAKGNRNYAVEAYRNLLKQTSKLNGVIFKNCDYKKLAIPYQSIIYCDPPYKGTDKYRGFEQIDHDEFWEGVRRKVNYGSHKVFISEFTAPNDFVEIWSMKISTAIAEKALGKNITEKLFVHYSQVEDYMETI